MIPEQNIETPISLSMSPYSGPWTFSEASHLLRRTMFGATYQQIQSAVSNGMNATVTSLLTVPSTTQPLTFDATPGFDTFNTTWVNSFCPNWFVSQPTEDLRNQSLGAWMVQKLNVESMSIIEKMCLFWQNHFAAENSFDARATYNYHALIRTHALGDFKQFLKEMSIDPSMLHFLNSVTNTVTNPNENFSRELLELYSIGKGPQAGLGDYTNYTETDVFEGAKILTGWVVDGMRSETAMPQAIFVTAVGYHDNSTKQLSAHFGNATIAANGATEYEDYIDVIFQQPALATYICNKIYRYFVNYDLTTDVETTVIPVLANTFISSNFSISAVIEELLLSDHFYDVSLRGSLIKSPLEFMFSMFNTTQSVPSFDVATNQKMYVDFYSFAGAIGQSYGSPPNVGGWSAYYQSPSFSKLWINSTFLKQRFSIGAYLTVSTGHTVNGNTFKINVLGFVDGLLSPSDPVAVIDDMCQVLFPKPIGATQKLVLKSILTNYLPDFEWTTQYTDYVNNPGNTTYSTPVRQRVEFVLFTVYQMPEFHTI
jgi:uncharacterized protein (DUF1800 family)